MIPWDELLLHLDDLAVAICDEYAAYWASVTWRASAFIWCSAPGANITVSLA